MKVPVVKNPARLIVFTRYPHPGRAKTRLIPALGKQGATDLHRRMTEHTVRQARGLDSGQAIRGSAGLEVSVEIHYTGGRKQWLRNWLGGDLAYRRQVAGGLGRRMNAAFTAAFSAGAPAVVIIGTDCPGLTSTVIAEAFAALASNELVLGPASDGGYYLIGLVRPVPELFAGIAWGTDQVLAGTIECAERLQLAIALLEVLDDVDRPEDLARAQAFLQDPQARSGM
jgi:rSAM/selenodomain-associated transferase 1